MESIKKEMSYQSSYQILFKTDCNFICDFSKCNKNNKNIADELKS
jgi:hypothetical protein